jgi:hypothetical protein
VTNPRRSISRTACARHCPRSSRPIASLNLLAVVLGFGGNSLLQNSGDIGHGPSGTAQVARKEIEKLKDEERYVLEVY